MKRWWLFLGLVAAVALAGEEPTMFRVYTVRAPLSDAAVEVLRDLVVPDGQVVYDPPHRLLVIATEETHQRIADALQQMDAPPLNVRLTVRFQRQGSAREQEAGLSASREFVRHEGLTHTTIRVKPRIVDETTTLSENTAQMLLVASGSEASIAVGEEVPYLTWLMAYGRKCGLLREEIIWEKVGAYLVAQPTVVGNGPLVRIRLIPELRGMVKGVPYRIRFSQVATEVVAQDGQTFPLGALDQNAEFYSRYLIGRGRSGGYETLQITLTPEIVRVSPAGT